MKLLQRLAAVLFLLTVSAVAADKDKKALATKAQKPSLTYYYFEG